MLLLLLAPLAMRPELAPDQVTVVEQGGLPALPREAIRAGVLGGTCSYSQAVDASGAVESVMVFDVFQQPASSRGRPEGQPQVGR